MVLSLDLLEKLKEKHSAWLGTYIRLLHAYVASALLEAYKRCSISRSLTWTSLSLACQMLIPNAQQVPYALCIHASTGTTNHPQVPSFGFGNQHIGSLELKRLWSSGNRFNASLAAAGRKDPLRMHTESAHDLCKPPRKGHHAFYPWAKTHDYKLIHRWISGL